jgi:hypothetical protein
MAYHYGIRPIWCFPPNTPASWNTLFSGASPYEHGVLDFYYVDYVNGSWRYKFFYEHPPLVPRFWDIVPNNTIMAVISVPTSSLSLFVRDNVILVGDWLSPKPFCRNCERYGLRPITYESNYTSGERFVENSIKELSLISDIVEHLIARFHPHFPLLVIPHTDWAGHKIHGSKKLLRSSTDYMA